MRPSGSISTITERLIRSRSARSRIGRAQLHRPRSGRPAIGAGLGIAFDEIPRLAAIDHVDAGAGGVGAIGVVGFEDAAKGGRDRDPRLLVYLLVELASERLCHLPRGPLSPDVSRFRPREMKMGGSGCCHYPIRRCPIAGRPATRATWGRCLLARAPDLCRPMKGAACMKLPSFSPCSGSFAAPAFCLPVSSSVREGMTRD
jgi:hypothetical protein